MPQDPDPRDKRIEDLKKALQNSEALRREEAEKAEKLRQETIDAMFEGMTEHTLESDRRPSEHDSDQ